MRYQMKQKMLSFGNDFSVLNESGQEAYFIDGKAFTFGNQLSVKTPERKEIAYISQKLMRFRQTYHVTKDKNLVAEIVKSPFHFKDRFNIDIPGPDNITVKGNLFQHEYNFLRNGAPIASVSKRFFSMRDTYGIEIESPEDELLVLSCAVVIDLVSHNEDNK